METVAVLDFETTGLSPSQGDRATEIAVALVRGGQIIDRFQSLMNSGRRIPSEVTQLTGITNAMISADPPATKVMREAAKFVGALPVVAHNASFDKRFWQAELSYLGIPVGTQFACTMLLSRRVYPQSPNHRLSTLVHMLGLPTSGRAHRAMVDVEMTCHLWSRIELDIAEQCDPNKVNHALLSRLQKVPRAKMLLELRAYASGD